MINFILYLNIYKSTWEMKAGDYIWVNNIKCVIEKIEKFSNFYTRIEVWYKSLHSLYNNLSSIIFVNSPKISLFPRTFELELLNSSAGLLINRDNSLWVSKERITQRNYMGLMKKTCDFITDFRYSPFVDKDSMLKYNSRSDIVCNHLGQLL